MPDLPPAPPEPFDETGAPRLGAFLGAFERVRPEALAGPGAAGLLKRVGRLKRWWYALLGTPELTASLVIADLGYVANGFCCVVDRRTRRTLFDQGFLGLPGASARVGDRPGVGASAHFQAGLVELNLERLSPKYLGTLRAPGLSLNFTLDTASAPPPLSLVCPVPGGPLNVTQKWPALPLQGSLVVGSERFILDGGLGGLDYTCGLLPRTLSWRWAFATGRAEDGRVLGLNLGHGLNDGVPGENALWLDGAVSLLPTPAFEFDPADPLQPWRLRTPDGAVDLTFHASGAHREHRNLLLAQSRFTQVQGELEGELAAPGGRLRLRGVPAVVEDQTVRW